MCQIRVTSLRATATAAMWLPKARSGPGARTAYQAASTSRWRALERPRLAIRPWRGLKASRSTSLAGGGSTVVLPVANSGILAERSMISCASAGRVGSAVQAVDAVLDLKEVGLVLLVDDRARLWIVPRRLVGTQLFGRQAGDLCAGARGHVRGPSRASESGSRPGADGRRPVADATGVGAQDTRVPGGRGVGADLLTGLEVAANCLVRSGYEVRKP